MAQQRFGGDLLVYGEILSGTQGTQPTSVVTRAFLDQVEAFVKDRANHTGTQLAATISDLPSILDARIQQVVGAAPAALDTLEEIAARLADDADAAAALTNTVTAIRTDLTALGLRVDTTESDITSLRSDVDALTGASGDLASQADLDALELRVDSVETLAAAAATEADLTTAEGRITATEGRLDALDTKTDATDAAVTAVEGRLDVVEDLAADAATQAALQTEIDARVAADTALDTRLDVLEAVTVFKATVGGSPAPTINHGLNSLDVEVIVIDLTDGQTVFPVVTRPSVNEVKLDFGSYTPTANSIRAIVKKYV